jgi:hypothetical protein
VKLAKRTNEDGKMTEREKDRIGMAWRLSMYYCKLYDSDCCFTLAAEFDCPKEDCTHKGCHKNFKYDHVKDKIRKACLECKKGNMSAIRKCDEGGWSKVKVVGCVLHPYRPH